MKALPGSPEFFRGPKIITNPFLFELYRNARKVETSLLIDPLFQMFHT